MKRRFSILLIVFVLSGLLAQGQSVSGVVVDADTSQPIPFAHVFLSNTTSVTITNEDGSFHLSHPRVGDYQLAVTFLGYETYVQNIELNSVTPRLTIKLKLQSQSLETVTISAPEDRAWRKNLKTFKKHFLGETENARSCELVNPWVLEFKKKGTSLKATATQPLEIQNRAFGYQLIFYLQQFEMSADGYKIIGPVRFQETGEGGQEDAIKNRAKIFQGSVAHFLRSLQMKSTREEGFKMYEPINAVKAQDRSLYFGRDLGVILREVKPDEVLKEVGPGYTVAASKPLEVHYEPGLDFQPVYRDRFHPVSWIQSSTGFVHFDSLGNILNPTDVMVIGYWNRLRVGDLLPLDFQIEKTEGEPGILNQESLVILTDKDAYHQGETIWYSSFVTNPRRDRPSHRLFVDMLDSANQIISQRMEPIENHQASGFFQVPAEKEGVYFLRAYTHNTYQQGSAQVKPIVILPDNHALYCDKDVEGSTLFTAIWELDSTITEQHLLVAVIDPEQDTLQGDFLISVSNAKPCLKWKGRTVIFKRPEAKKDLAEVLPGGRISNPKGQGLAGRILLTATDLSMSFEKHLDSSGSFDLHDIVTFDSTDWIIQFYDKKERPVADYRLTWNEGKEKYEFPDLTWRISYRVVERDSIQKPGARLISETEKFVPKEGVRVLDEVLVKGLRDKDEQPVFRSYGRPDYVVKAEEIARNPGGTNVLSALVGKVPGLTAVEGGSSWTGYMVTFNVRKSNRPPLIILDGLPMDDYTQAYQVLQTIPLHDIDRVEIRVGLSPLLGLNGGAGVIAVYTKRTGLGFAKANARTVNPFVRKVRIGGYSTLRKFEVTDSTTQGTLHWNASASLGEKPYLISLPHSVQAVFIRITGLSPTDELIDLTQRVVWKP